MVTNTIHTIDTGCTGQPGDADTKPAPRPATTTAVASTPINRHPHNQPRAAVLVVGREGPGRADPARQAARHLGVPAIDADGQPRDGAQAGELTGLLPGESYTRPGPGSSSAAMAAPGCRPDAVRHHRRHTAPGHGHRHSTRPRLNPVLGDPPTRPRHRRPAAPAGLCGRGDGRVAEPCALRPVEVAPDCGCGGVWYPTGSAPRPAPGGSWSETTAWYSPATTPPYLPARRSTPRLPGLWRAGPVRHRRPDLRHTQQPTCGVAPCDQIRCDIHAPAPPAGARRTGRVPAAPVGGHGVAWCRPMWDSRVTPRCRGGPPTCRRRRCRRVRFRTSAGTP